MTWPSKRVQKSALWRLTDPETDLGSYRARVVRKRDTRRMVQANTPGQRRDGRVSR